MDCPLKKYFLLGFPYWSEIVNNIFAYKKIHDLFFFSFFFLNMNQPRTRLSQNCLRSEKVCIIAILYSIWFKIHVTAENHWEYKLLWRKILNGGQLQCPVRAQQVLKKADFSFRISYMTTIIDTTYVIYANYLKDKISMSISAFVW